LSAGGQPHLAEVILSIVTSGPQAVDAAQRATRTIPIVMAVIQDPVTLGFVASLARPGRNITGVSFQDSDLVTRRLQLFKEAMPGVTRVAALWNPSGSDPTTLSAVKSAAASLGIGLQILEVRVAEDLPKAFDAAKQKRAQALVQLASPLFAAHRKTVLDLWEKGRFPATCQEGTFVVDGCLMAYGPSFLDMFRRAAYYVDRILKGAKPADLPVERATTFEFVINLKTARALGLTTPQSLLQRRSGH
jgi:putative ABC transport system substrate-binding protein